MSFDSIPSKTEVMGWNARTLADYMNRLKLSGCDKVVMKKSIDGARFLKMTDVDLQKFPRVHVPIVTNIQNEINRRGMKKSFSLRLNASRYPKQDLIPDKDTRDADQSESECDNEYDCPEECMEREESDICPMSEPSEAGLRESEEGSDDDYEVPPSEQNVLPRPLGLGKPLEDGEYIGGSLHPPPQRTGRETAASGGSNAHHPLPKMDASGQRSVKTPALPHFDRSRKPGQCGLPKKDLPKSGEGSPAPFKHKIPQTEDPKPSDRSAKFNQPPPLPQSPRPSIRGRSSQHGQTPGKLARHPLPKIDASANMSNKPDMTEITRLIDKTTLKRTSSLPSSTSSTKFNTAPPLPQSPKRPSIRGRSSQHGQTLESECDNVYDCPEECPMSEPCPAGLRESEEGSDDEYEDPPSEQNVLPRPLGLGKPLGDGEYIDSPGRSPNPLLQRPGSEAGASGRINGKLAHHPLPKIDTSANMSNKPDMTEITRLIDKTTLKRTSSLPSSTSSTKFNTAPPLPQSPKRPSIRGRSSQHGQTLESECDNVYDCPEECPMSEPCPAGLRESEEGSDDEYEDPPSEQNVLPRPLGLGKPLGDGEYIDSPGRSPNPLLQRPCSEAGASGRINGKLARHPLPKIDASVNMSNKPDMTEITRLINKTKLKKASSFSSSTQMSPQTKDPKPSETSNRSIKFNTAPPLPQSPKRPSIRGRSSLHGQTLESECDDLYDCPEECMEGGESDICPMSEPCPAGLRESEEGSDDEYEDPPSEQNVLPRPLGLGKPLGDGEYIDSPGRSPNPLLQRPGSEAGASGRINGKLARHPLPKIDASVNMSNKPDMTEITRLINKTKLKKASSFSSSTQMSPQTKDPKPSETSNRSTKFNTAPPLPQSPKRPSIRGRSSLHGQTLTESAKEGRESYICPMSEPSPAGLRESEEGSDDEYEDPPSEQNVLPRSLGLGKPLGDGEYIGRRSHSPQRPGREASASTSSHNNGKLDVITRFDKTKLRKAYSVPLPQTKDPKPSETFNRSTKFNTAPPLPQSPRPSSARSSQHGQTLDMDPCWYKGQVTRPQAEAALRKVNKDGAFVVRDSSTGSSEQPYTLMVLYQDKVYNIQIRNHGNSYSLGTGLKNCESFPRVKEVIDYYTHTPLVLINSLDRSSAYQSRLLHPAAL